MTHDSKITFLYPEIIMCLQINVLDTAQLELLTVVQIILLKKFIFIAYMAFPSTQNTFLVIINDTPVIFANIIYSHLYSIHLYIYILYIANDILYTSMKS